MDKELNLENVLHELSQDNKIALNQLFNHFYPRLYNFSKVFLKLEDGIDDILQEVFIKIWQNRKKISNTHYFNAYIFTITRNLLLNELRHRLNDHKIKEEIYKRSVAEEYLISEQIDYKELKRELDQMVQELPDNQRKVFLLSRSDGLSHREIAQRLNISEKTVEYHIHLSISILRDKLKNFGFLGLFYLYFFL